MIEFKGNIITLRDIERDDAYYYLSQHGIEQYALLGNQTNRLYSLSYPMRAEDRIRYRAEIHRHNNQNLLGKKLDIREDGPDIDPTPPRGGGARPVALSFLDACSGFSKVA
jgi:hypothetical protein